MLKPLPDHLARVHEEVVVLALLLPRVLPHPHVLRLVEAGRVLEALRPHKNLVKEAE